MVKPKLNLADDHRSAWQKLVGKRKVFRAVVKRFGHKHRQGEKIKKGATLVLVDVHQRHSKNTIDHVWVDYTPELAKFGEHIRPKALIEFSAVVGSYVKGGKNAFNYDVETFDDLKLTDVQDVKIIKEPYWSKKYVPLMDEELISFVIRSKQNLKQGTTIGQDPWGRLGAIKVGQGFANRLAKKLTWRWFNELPVKYRWDGDEDGK